jgi:hypothetical protein
MLCAVFSLQAQRNKEGYLRPYTDFEATGVDISFGFLPAFQNASDISIRYVDAPAHPAPADTFYFSKQLASNPIGVSFCGKIGLQMPVFIEDVPLYIYSNLAFSRGFQLEAGFKYFLESGRKSKITFMFGLGTSMRFLPYRMGYQYPRNKDYVWISDNNIVQGGIEADIVYRNWAVNALAGVYIALGQEHNFAFFTNINYQQNLASGIRARLVTGTTPTSLNPELISVSNPINQKKPKNPFSNSGFGLEVGLMYFFGKEIWY